MPNAPQFPLKMANALLCAVCVLGVYQYKFRETHHLSKYVVNL